MSYLFGEAISLLHNFVYFLMALFLFVFGSASLLYRISRSHVHFSFKPTDGIPFAFCVVFVLAGLDFVLQGTWLRDIVMYATIIVAILIVLIYGLLMIRTNRLDH